MTKKELKTLIYDLTVKMERYEEQYRQHRDEMYEAEGAMGELQLLIWKLEKME